MSLFDEASEVLRQVLTEPGGHGVDVVLTDPAARVFALRGLHQDIGLSIDPETGVQVMGRRASVALPLVDLAASGIPRQVPETDQKPWTVLMLGVTYRVTGAIPDRFGCVVLTLEAYRS